MTTDTQIAKLLSTVEALRTERTEATAIYSACLRTERDDVLPKLASLGHQPSIDELAQLAKKAKTSKTTKQSEKAKQRELAQNAAKKRVAQLIA